MRAKELTERPSIDGLTLGRRLGQGGFAEVYQARLGEREVAVKIARQGGDSHVRHEAAILRSLALHLRPALGAVAALVRDGTTSDDRPYLVLELVAGDSLACCLAPQRGAAVPAAIADPFTTLCGSVATIHDAGLVHLDIKPSNVLCRVDGSFALIDFGLARYIGEPGDEAGTGTSIDRTRTGEHRGTALYMAPEQWLHPCPVDQRTDVYALGVILYEWLTGEPPFSGSAAEIRHGHVAMRRPRPSERVPLPAAVDGVVLRSLARDPAERFAGARELAHAFRRALAVAPARPRAASPAGAPDATGSEATGPAQQADGDENVALLGLRTREDAVSLSSIAARYGAVIAVAGGERCVLAFPFAPSVSAGLRMALAAAELCARGPASRCVVHVGRLRVRRRGTRLRLHGLPIERPETWTDARPDASGQSAGPVVLTPTAVMYLEGARTGHARGYEVAREERAHSTQPDAVPALPLVDPACVSLRGRDQLVATLLAELRTLLVRASGLALLVGENGVGKTRVLHALARELRGRGECHVLYLRGASPSDRDAGELPRALLAGLAPWVRGPHARHAPGHESGAPDAVRRALAHELTGALQQAASATPLVVLLDDAQHADHATLDALRQATNAAAQQARCGLAVLAAAESSLLTLRPDWQQALDPRHLHELGPLDQDSARTLLRDLLHPVEHAPAGVLDRLVAFSGGVPLHLIELARTIRESGAIRRRPGHHSYFLASDEILADTTGHLDENLAQRALLALPAELAGLAEICAVLSDSFTREDARGVQRCLEAMGAGSAATGLDASVGLERLVHRGLLARQPGSEPGAWYRVRNALIARGIEARIEAGRRRELHRAALAHWQGMDGCPRHRLAHHASSAGASDLALSLHLELGDEARRRHRLVDAERHYTAAIEHAQPHTDGWAHALAGRGRIRYRLLRLDDALDDLCKARGFFAARGDERQRLALLLEEAKVLDWRQEYSLAAAISKEVAPAARQLGDPWLMAESELAIGRAHFRQNRFERGIEHLTAAASWARANGAEETLIIALLVLAPMLVYVGRLAAAAAAYEEVIRACQEAGDDFHLATAYLNRITLWVELAHTRPEDGDGFARIVDDMERCIALGHALGNAQFEQIATMNLAEFLYWNGSFDRALALAERSRELQMKLFSSYGNVALLLARIACALGDASARNHVEWIARSSSLSDMPPAERDLLRMACLSSDALEGKPVRSKAWNALARAVEAHAPLHEHVEVLITAAEIFWRCGRAGEARAWLGRAARAAGRSSLWSRRLDLLRDRLSDMK